MRGLLLIALVMFVLLAVGIIRYRSSQDEVTITIDKQKGRETTERVIEKGKELGSKLSEQGARTSEKPAGSAPQ